MWCIFVFHRKITKCDVFSFHTELEFIQLDSCLNKNKKSGSWFLNRVRFELKERGFCVKKQVREGRVSEVMTIKKMGDNGVFCPLYLFITFPSDRTTRRWSHWSAGWCPGASSPSWSCRRLPPPWLGCSPRGCPAWWCPLHWGGSWSNRLFWPHCPSGPGLQRRAWKSSHHRLYSRRGRLGESTTRLVGISCFWKKGRTCRLYRNYCAGRPQLALTNVEQV